VVDGGGVMTIGVCRDAGVLRSRLSKTMLEARDLIAEDGVGARSSAMIVYSLAVGVVDRIIC
jgi:hypothetical protein